MSETKHARRVEKMRTSPVRDLFAAAVRSDIISLSGGMPDVSLLPASAIRKATRAAVEDERAQALQYGTTLGRDGLKRVFCGLMRDIGVRCKPEEVAITSGAQEALDLIGKVFLDEGDIVIVEGPTYLTALQAFSAYEPDVRSVPFDDEGMRMDLLEEELERIGKNNPRLKFLYTIPNFQNPGGVTMTPARRKRLLELSREYGFIVIEDDPYGRLRYEGGHQIPLKALDDDTVLLHIFDEAAHAGDGPRRVCVRAGSSRRSRSSRRSTSSNRAPTCAAARSTRSSSSTTSPTRRGSARCRSS